MKGYTTLKQVIEDYNLYLASIKISPTRSKETLTSYIRKRIKQKILNGSPKFKQMMNKSKYKHFDLILLALNDTFRNNTLKYFLGEMPNNLSDKEMIKKILKSPALNKLNAFKNYIPNKLTSKQDMETYLKSIPLSKYRHVETICVHFAGKKCREWLFEVRKRASWLFKHEL